MCAKYWEEYSKSVEIDLSDVSDSTRTVINAVMREGELKYRDELIEIFRAMKETAGLESVSVDAVIGILETVDVNEEPK